MRKLNDIETFQNRDSYLGCLIRTVLRESKLDANESKKIYDTFASSGTAEDIDEMCPAYYDRWVTTTILSGMIIEAFLYDYAVVQQSKDYADKVSQLNLNDEFRKIAYDHINKDDKYIEEICSTLELFNNARNRVDNNIRTIKWTPIGQLKASEWGQLKEGLFNYLEPLACKHFLRDFFKYFSNNNPNYPLSEIILSQLNDS